LNCCFGAFQTAGVKKTHRILPLNKDSAYINKDKIFEHRVLAASVQVATQQAHARKAAKQQQVRAQTKTATDSRTTQHTKKMAAAAAAAQATAQRAVEHAVLSVAKRLEDQLDAQLHKLDTMGDDDLERLRQKRLDDLKKQQDLAREWAARGHGQYTELMEEKAFFKEVKGEERVVAHFYRENWPCKVMDRHLELLSRRHMETKFFKVWFWALAVVVLLFQRVVVSTPFDKKRRAGMQQQVERRSSSVAHTGIIGNHPLDQPTPFFPRPNRSTPRRARTWSRSSRCGCCPHWRSSRTKR
jgi:hypothetical protein